MSYLIHHGVKGQEWGVRNGPPYPLGSGDHSAREKRAGWRNSLRNRARSEVYRQNRAVPYDDARKKFELTDKQKKYIKIGAAVAATAIATYAAYKIVGAHGGYIHYLNPRGDSSKVLYDTVIKDTRLNSKRLNKVLPKSTLVSIVNEYDEVSRFDSTVKSVKDLPKWASGENTVTNSLSVINPQVSSITNGRALSEMPKWAIDGLLSTGHQDRMFNCQYCSIAYEMNRRGIKCMANGRPVGGLWSQMGDVFKITDKKAIMRFSGGDKANTKAIIKAFEKYGSGARGNLQVSWKSGGAHSIAWENINGKFHLVDAQSGKTYTGFDDLDKFFKTTKGAVNSIRVDNAEVNWSSEMLLNALEVIAN